MPDSTVTEFKLPPGQIQSDLKQLRKLIGGLVAKLGGAGFPTKSAKELMIKVREAADELGMVSVGFPIDITPSVVFCGIVEKNGKPVLNTISQVVGLYRFESADGSYRDCMGYGAGWDNSDKFAGKASTYAWKDALVKALTLPDEEMKDTDDEHNPVEGTTKVPSVSNTTPANPLLKVL